MVSADFARLEYDHVLLLISHGFSSGCTTQVQAKNIWYYDCVYATTNAHKNTVDDKNTRREDTGKDRSIR